MTITGVTDAMPPFAMAPLRKVGPISYIRCLMVPVKKNREWRSLTPLLIVEFLKLQGFVSVIHD